MSNHPHDLLRYAAKRAADRSFFLASVLREYQELQGMDEEQLARELGCDRRVLPRLGLCRRPASVTGTFRADVERIATHLGISPTALARVVRTVDVARQLRTSAAPTGAGPLLAARDRPPDDGRPTDGEAATQD